MLVTFLALSGKIVWRVFGERISLLSQLTRLINGNSSLHILLAVNIYSAKDCSGLPGDNDSCGGDTCFNLGWW